VEEEQKKQKKQKKQILRFAQDDTGAGLWLW